MPAGGIWFATPIICVTSELSGPKKGGALFCDETRSVPLNLSLGYIARRSSSEDWNVGGSFEPASTPRR